METARSFETIAAAATKRVRESLDLVRDTRVGRLLARIGIAPKAASSESLLDLAGALLSLRGRASGPSLASAFFDLYEASDAPSRHGFLEHLHQLYPRDTAAIDKAITEWQQDHDDAAAERLRQATESPCRRLIRQLNLAPSGTRRLIAMRADLLGQKMTPGLKALDRDFAYLFETWFNAGFLELRRIDWNSPAAILERIIAYEAVHFIDGWDDLRRRMAPADRRCYGFFHPQMADDPLIFVEVALTDTLPSAIRQIIAEDRVMIDPHQASSAIFYSISNCQEGLRGIPFGNFLIKQVASLLKRELPHLQHFATLSPVPGFAKSLPHQAGNADGTGLGDADLRALAARFIVQQRNQKGQVADSVARFHLGNGARLEAVHAGADLSAKGQRESHGVMVNYLYDLNAIEANLFALSELGTVAHSVAVQELLEPSAEKRKRRTAKSD